MATGTIAVCTRNRLAQLRQCLASLETQYSAAHAFDVLVVDNGSTDGTGAFLDGWQRSGRRVVAEPRPGLARARNVALRASDADVVLYLDDDALAPSTWLRNHLDVYACDAAVAAVGGPVQLMWPGDRPAWAGAAVEHWWSAFDLGTQRGPWPTPHGPYGTNMSVDRASALAAGGFPLALGRKGRSLLSSEEAVLSMHLARAGAVVFYEPAAVLMHQVLPERVSRLWILRRGVAQGRSNTRRALLSDELDARQLAGEARAEARHAFRCGRDLLDVRPAVTSADAIDRVSRLAGHVAAASSFATLAATGGRRVRRP